MHVSARARRHVGELPVTVTHVQERLRAVLHDTSGHGGLGHDTVLAVVEEARRVGGPVAAAQTLAVAHHRLLHPALGDLRHRIAEDLIAESSRTRRHGDTLAGLLWRAVDLILDGDGRAARCLTELRSLLAVRDQPDIRFALLAIEAMLEIRAGRFESAEQYAQRCAALGAELGDVDAATWYTSHLIAIRWYQGRVGELLPTIQRTAGSPTLSPTDHSYRSALAVAAAAAGHRDEALDALAATVDSVVSQEPRSGSWLVATYGLVEAAHLLGESRVAEQAYELLLPYARLPVTAGPAISCFGSVEHALGLARLTLGDHEGAAAHLCRAVTHNVALGHFPAAVLTRHRLAAALAQSQHPDDRARAAHEAQAARRDADELGMVLPDVGGSSVSRSGVMLSADAASCRRQGRHWRIDVAGRSVEVEDCRGMAYLAVLLANPGKEIPALELAELELDAAPSTPGVGDEELLAYRHRLKILEREIEHCDAVGDQEAGARAYAEHDLLLARLRTALGMASAAGVGVGTGSGAADHSPSCAVSEERARIAVGKAIRRALARVADADRPLGELLSATIRTGRLCAYLPLQQL